MKTMISMTLLSVLVSLVTGCETSNQNYSQGRVVDVTRAQATVNSAAQQAQRAVNNTAPVLTDVPLETPVESPAVSALPSQSTGYDTVMPVEDNIVTYTGNSLAGYDDVQGGSLIGGVPDGPLPEVTAGTTTAGTASSGLPQGDIIAQNSTPAAAAGAAGTGSPAQLASAAQPSDSSGNWLLVDSAEASKDVSNSAAMQRSIDSRAAAPAASTTAVGAPETRAGQVKALGPLPERYVVIKGDTLYSIAFRYGLDYHALARINNIEPPYNLALGQVLLLKLQSQRAPSYVVQKGDTLYSIARKNNQSVSFLAGVNNLEPPYNLTVGQRILLSRENSQDTSRPQPARPAEVPVAGQQSQIAQTTPQKAPSATQPGKPAAQAPAVNKVPPVAQTPVVNSKTRKVAGVTWSWPTSGKVIEQFSTAEQGNKGIDIAGNRGQAILSAADGQVVYSGNALRGFGNLIIINHNNEYLSAYAHNDVMLVKEGQKVKRGQHIARMGNTDAASPRLHFEIRYRGQSVNPVSYLPK